MIYLDSNALVKMVTAEQETDALMSHLERANARLVSSELARVEVRRALMRKEVPDSVLEDANELLNSVIQRDLASILDDASRLPQQHLRSLDALHLATALRLGDAVHQFITYDQRLAQAAHESNLNVLSPRAD